MAPFTFTRYRAAAAVAAAAIVAFAACESDTSSPTAPVQPAAPIQPNAAKTHTHGAHGGPVALTPEMLQAIARVRNATAVFHDITRAQAAGYDVQFPAGCAALPGTGAQGFHWINNGLVDDKVELLKPELVMYEPKPGGGMQLVGVDYVVPLSLSAEPPTLLGVPFAPLPELGVWALHIWAWRPNPDGMFAMWNPRVSCANQ
ncbi:MAG TPA: hypothetical protein VJQ44_10010 [Gemmatimonadales bacterium]|nr:hypothetical protein [Gemmatimonadales bacterium]